MPVHADPPAVQPWQEAHDDPQLAHDVKSGDPTQAPVPGAPGVQPSHAAQPNAEPHVEQSWALGVPVQAPGVSQPAQAPQPAPAAHAAHVENSGVPVHVGPVLKRCGGSAACALAVAQQIRAAPVQSESVEHDLGHVAWQMPLQHSSPVDAQSVDEVHALGYGAYFGLRQRPVAVTVGSTALTDVQHTSPTAVWHSELVAQLFGHSLDGRQIP
jgi:hypothetical protein